MHSSRVGGNTILMAAATTCRHTVSQRLIYPGLCDRNYTRFYCFVFDVHCVEIQKVYSEIFISCSSEYSDFTSPQLYKPEIPQRLVLSHAGMSKMVLSAITTSVVDERIGN